VELNPGAPTPQSLVTPATKWIDFAEVQMGCSIWIPDTYQHTLFDFSSNIWSPFSISKRIIRQDDNPESMIQMLQLYKENTHYTQFGEQLESTDSPTRLCTLHLQKEN
jgi:hypothetical protein